MMCVEVEIFPGNVLCKFVNIFEIHKNVVPSLYKNKQYIRMYVKV